MPYKPKRLKAILFDMDGTLADTETLGHRPAYNRAFKKLGLTWRWGPKLYRRLLNQPGGKERISHYLSRYSPEMGEHSEDVENDRQRWVDEVHHLKSDYYKSLIKRGKVPLREGISDLINDALDAGVKVAVVTNASEISTTSLLQHALGAKLRKRLSLVVTGSEAARKKPNPDLYLLALEKLNLDAAQCVVLEDSAMGLQAATAAGISTVVTVNANTCKENFSKAVLVVDGLGDSSRQPKVLSGKLRQLRVNLRTLDALCGKQAADI